MNAGDTTGRHLKRLRAEGVSVWLRGFHHPDPEGELPGLVAAWDLGGVTWTVDDVLAGGGRARLAELREGGADPARAWRRLSADATRAACDALLPLYEASRSGTGLVSADLPPAGPGRSAAQEARALWWAVDRSNLLLKIPGTPGSLETVSALVADGIGVDVTPVFSAMRYEQVFAALCAGLEQARRAGRALHRICSAVSLPIAPVDALVDRRLREQGLAAARYPTGEAARAHARVVYHLHEQAMSAPRWQRLAAQGARLPHLVWTDLEPAGPVRYADHLVAWGVVHALSRPALPTNAGSTLIGDALSGRHITARQDLEALYAFGLSYEELARELETAWLADREEQGRALWRDSARGTGSTSPAPAEPNPT
ncbi:transaldolase family protein [Streptomyces sp. NPDC004629]|uniref:transaldolase family protein n=1 Tax=Streptomyces sp. NPDC004629 TaxID=3364705 RepID=UPI00369B9D77